MALSDLFGIDSTAGTSELEEALAKVKAALPTGAQLTLPMLQQFVVSGVLSPQQYQAISADPQAFQDIANSADQSGVNAQKSALQQLGGIVQAGGSTPINQANLMNNINTTNQAMQGARQGIQENAQERGVAGGGQEFLSQLLNEQGNAQNANMGAVNAASNNAQLALQALANQGNLGGAMQGQENQMAQAKAQAAQQAAEYNSQLQSMANQYNTQNANSAQAANLANAQNVGNMNTQNANMRTQYNAQVPEMMFQNANQMANSYGNLSNLKQQQAQNQAGFTGNLIGAGATVLGGMYGGPMGAAAGAQLGKSLSGGQSGTEAVNSGYGSQPTGENANPYRYGINPYSTNGYAMGGEVQCYAAGGEVHDHQLCMKAGGAVPDDGSQQMPGDNPQNDTVPAMLSPNEIVLPKSVSQAPNAPEAAQQFVQGIKGGQPTPDFASVIQMLEANGLELRLGAKNG